MRNRKKEDIYISLFGVDVNLYIFQKGVRGRGITIYYLFGGMEQHWGIISYISPSSVVRYYKIRKRELKYVSYVPNK